VWETCSILHNYPDPVMLNHVIYGKNKLMKFWVNWGFGIK